MATWYPSPMEIRWRLLIRRIPRSFESLLRHGISQDSWNWTKTVTRLNNERHHLPQQEFAFMLGSLLEATDTTVKER